MSDTEERYRKGFKLHSLYFGTHAHAKVYFPMCTSASSASSKGGRGKDSGAVAPLCSVPVAYVATLLAVRVASALYACVCVRMRVRVCVCVRA